MNDAKNPASRCPIHAELEHLLQTVLSSIYERFPCFWACPWSSALILRSGSLSGTFDLKKVYFAISRCTSSSSPCFAPFKPSASLPIILPGRECLLGAPEVKDSANSDFFFCFFFRMSFFLEWLFEFSCMLSFLFRTVATVLPPQFPIFRNRWKLRGSLYYFQIGRTFIRKRPLDSKLLEIFRRTTSPVKKNARMKAAEERRYVYRNKVLSLSISERRNVISQDSFIFFLVLAEP